MKYHRIGLFCCLLVAGVVFAQSPRLVTVDFQQVFEEYRELQRLDRKMKSDVQAFRDELEVKLQALQSRNQDFQELRGQAAAEGLTVEEREQLIEQAAEFFRELKTEEQAIQQEQQAFQEKMETRAMRLRREIADSVTAHIEEMSRERGWDVVLDTSAQGASGLPVVVYADAGADVTLDVIRSLNLADAEEAEPTVTPVEAAAEETGEQE